MKWKDGSVEREMWDISYSHLKKLIPVKKKMYRAWLNNVKGHGIHIFLKETFKRTKKKQILEIKFLERELKYRNDYPEYRTFCELFVIGINEKVNHATHIHKTVRNDPSFLLSFSGWCEDHNMMVQSRKLMRMIDRIKGYQKESV